MVRTILKTKQRIQEKYELLERQKQLNKNIIGIKGIRNKDNKIVFIINSSGGVGKDTLINIVSKYYLTINVSTIDIVRKAGNMLGCINKTEDDRQFLSKLKELADEYYKHSINYVMQQYESFINSKYNIMFIHCREPHNIDEIKSHIPNCKTLLVTNKNVKHINSNKSDGNVYKYNYDYTINNDGSIEELEDKVKKMFGVGL